MAHEENPQLTAILRHGCMTCRTSCDTSATPDLKAGDEVVARTERGVEYALILTDPEASGPTDTSPADAGVSSSPMSFVFP